MTRPLYVSLLLSLSLSLSLSCIARVEDAKDQAKVDAKDDATTDAKDDAKLDAQDDAKVGAKDDTQDDGKDDEKVDAKDDAESLDGTWLASAAELGGEKFPDEVTKSIKLVLGEGKYTVTVGANPDTGTVTLDPTKEPKSLDITGTEGPNTGKTILAIYEKTDDTLRICYDLSGAARPTEFKTAKGTQLFLVTYSREQP